MSDQLQVYTSLATPALILAGLMMAYMLMMRQMRFREREAERQLGQKILADENHEAEASGGITVDQSGYVILQMPEAQKTHFLDLLKGFEEFATLKGYKISFAFDASLSNRVAFRFTILEGGISVSTNKVRDDLKEYISRVESGSTFDDLDIIIPAGDHHSTLLILKNRLNFVQSPLRLKETSSQHTNGFSRIWDAQARRIPLISSFKTGDI